jgi:hypothetical protein
METMTCFTQILSSLERSSIGEAVRTILHLYPMLESA